MCAVQRRLLLTVDGTRWNTPRPLLSVAPTSAPWVNTPVHIFQISIIPHVMHARACRWWNAADSTVYWREWSLREARLCAYRGQ